MRKSCMKRKSKSKHEKFMESVLLDCWPSLSVIYDNKRIAKPMTPALDIEFLFCTCNKKFHGSDCVLGPKK